VQRDCLKWLRLKKLTKNRGETDLGPLVEFNEDELLLRGWRSISLINIMAVLLPLMIGLIILLIDGWGQWLALGPIAFAGYGCWAIYRGTYTKIVVHNDSIRIDSEEIQKSALKKFDGRRVSKPSGMDDNESGTELWAVMRNGAEVPILQMSGYARIEKIADFLNSAINETNSVER